ncbi:MAG: sigma-70 family RNA polymerase sigma factor [Oscillospiraceae bacterium]|nr:sigma-70 family RNA polymerase sigma factor [Ruminococcus sp.]MDY6061179.1 sigma-70 family RNA polymerase sigma factor [Oscillospiraceae bacterium]
MTEKSVRDIKIEENLGLVHSCARRFTGRGVDYEDLVQAGCIGLIKAVDNFDDERGFSFSTYAVPVILGEIKRIFRDDGTVKVSRIIKDRGRKISYIKEEFSRINGHEPTVGDISSILGISEEETAQAINASLPVFSLTPAEDGDSRGEFDVPTESYDAEIADKIALRQIMEQLEDRDKKLIEYRYFKGLNQTKTAELLNMNQVWVSRREKAILLIMKKKLA